MNGIPCSISYSSLEHFVRHCSVKNLGSFGTRDFFFVLISSSGIELFLRVKFLHSKHNLTFLFSFLNV